MRKFNITTKRQYESKGETKTQWNQVGTLVRFDATQDKPESYILELSMFPDTKFFVFEQEQKAKPEPKEEWTPDPRIPESEQGNPDEIPF